MTQAKVNLFQLRNAKAQERLVRFVYNTKGTGNLVPRVGTVDSVTDTHAVILDTFHGGAPRSVILERIVGAVELDRTV
ncbi:MAG: hypothetical protein WC965_01205 [Thiohalomonadaceae bacterium]